MKSIKYVVGEERMDTSPLPAFSDDVCALLKEYDAAIRKDREARMFPDVVSVGYWCRNANIQKKKERFGDCSKTVGRGLAFHITPGNIPVNFMFSFLFSLLAGNANIVRIPTRQYPQVTILLRILSECLKGHPEISKRTAFVTYSSSNDEITASFCRDADVRVIWGGDRTVNHIRSFPTKPRCIDVAFADRYSMAVLSAEAIRGIDEKALARLAHGFYNDTYLMDQNACSSPKLCVWVDRDEDGKKRFWDAVGKEAVEHYALQPAVAVDKYTALCHDIMDQREINTIRRIGNYLYVIGLQNLPRKITAYSGKGGYFYETQLERLDELSAIADNQKIQTIVYYGVDPEAITQAVVKNHLNGIDRIVPTGSAMDIDSDWDGFDLIRTMSRTIVIK